MAVTLAQLRTAIREKADQELGPGQDPETHFITDTTLTKWVNAAIKRIYDILVKADGDYYIEEDEFTTVAGTLRYDLPEDFYRLKGLDERIETNEYREIKKYNFSERNKGGLRYRIQKNQISFNTDPGGGRTFRITYVPKFEDLTNDNDAFDGVNGWEEYVVFDGAIQCYIKEESDTSALQVERQAAYDRIVEMADDRDQGEPDSVSDVSHRSRIDRYGWSWDDQ